MNLTRRVIFISISQLLKQNIRFSIISVGYDTHNHLEYY